MKYVEIRQAFIDFFQSKQHQLVASSSLIPHEDPTLMFTNAGMNQFKDVFIGAEQRDYKRAVSIQKCIRAGGKHNDLENVGFTARHHTFFEMMGNFSFGDYFKKEAIEMAWEFLTETLKIPKERLYVTVFKTDDEAAEIWQNAIGIPLEKIFRYGEKDNFWRMGQTGPCGPCSEIFYDHNPSGPQIPIHEDEDRFVEIWNLVFMQFFEDEDGQQSPLPKPSVDTGSGIERVASALQGFNDNYQCDVFQPLIEKTCELAGLPSQWEKLKQNPETLGAVKVVADHARTAAFLIAEGVLPSNEGRGYVLRRIMRRAIRYARKLNSQQSIYPAVVAQVIAVMAPHYPELQDKHKLIIKATEDEQKRFLQTLDKGSEILSQKILSLKEDGQDQIDGLTAFTLYDTYGFPLDLTQVVAKENGFDVDEKGFLSAMEGAKDKARKAQKSHTISRNEKFLVDWTQKYSPTDFVGYHQLHSQSELIGLSDSETETTTLSGEGLLIFKNTAFYAEGGGQVADHGEIWDNERKNKLGEIKAVKKLNDVFVHFVELTEEVQRGQSYTLIVNSQDRLQTAANHSATHLLNAALKKVIGNHTNQAGSLVNPQKLRFDFNHNQPLTPKELGEIESLVNLQIAHSSEVEQETMSQDAAKNKGATAMFGEKYGSEVRVITIGTDNQPAFSMELCGGTHVSNTSQIRLFKIVNESGVAAGVRRIEALTGARALQYLNELAEENLSLRRELKLSVPKVEDQQFAPVSGERIATVQQPKPITGLKDAFEQSKDKIKKLEQDLKKKSSQSFSADDLLKQAEETTLAGESGLYLFTQVNTTDRNILSEMADKIRDKKPRVAMVLAGESEEGKPTPLIVAISKSLKSLHAGKITKELCNILDGKGGGRPDFAQGSFTKVNQWQSAKDKFIELIQS